MNQIAQNIIDQRIDKLKKLSYDQIRHLLEQKDYMTEEFVAPDGREYQLDIRVHYDDKKIGTIRVHGSVYVVRPNSKWWQLWKNVDSPVAYTDFIIRSDGSFI